MTLARRTIIASLVLALPAAALIVFVTDQVRTRDMATSLGRMVQGSLTEAHREACEADPQWFLAGPRESRPTRAERSQPDADVNLRRPSKDELPFEFFPYDDQFSGTSTASPRFPEDFKRAMRTSPPTKTMFGPYESKSGTGLQMGQLTGWAPGPCSVLLFRLRPSPNPVRTRVLLFGSAFVICALIVFAAMWPVTARVTRLAKAARESARADYSQIATVSGNDDISSLAAAFNEAAADIRKRIVDTQDREEALRRHVEVTKEDVAAPLGELEQRLGELVSRADLSSGAADDVRRAVRDAHQLRARLQNLASVARLRAVTDQSPRETIDLTTLVAHVVASRAALARAAAVSLDLVPPDAGVAVTADGLLLEQAIGNVLDNAILHSGPGARVRVELRGFEHGGRFSLRVSDDGRSVPDEAFTELTANRRFRGDESRTRRPGGRGLGLALAREVADRFGLQLDLRRPNAGGLEAELRPRDK
jgi:signal transduction histidine kinase